MKVDFTRFINYFQRNPADMLASEFIGQLNQLADAVQRVKNDFDLNKKDVNSKFNVVAQETNFGLKQVANKKQRDPRAYKVMSDQLFQPGTLVCYKGGSVSVADLSNVSLPATDVVIESLPGELWLARDVANFQLILGSGSPSNSDFELFLYTNGTVAPRSVIESAAGDPNTAGWRIQPVGWWHGLSPELPNSNMVWARVSINESI